MRPQRGRGESFAPFPSLTLCASASVWFNMSGMGRGMQPEQRRRRILEVVARRQRASVEQLAEELAVSRETIRRDLTVLENDGQLRKVHGGAVNVQTASESAFSRRRTEQREEKRRIARLAAELFGPGDTLMIDTGTTTAIFAYELAKRSGITVITNSVEIAVCMSRSSGGHRVYLLGGEVFADAGESLGAITIEQIAQYRADHAVLTVGAIDMGGGFMDFNIEEAMVAKAMIRQSRTVTIVADHTKMSRRAMAKVCDFAGVARLVTDRAPEEPLASALAAAGVEVLVA